MHHLLLLALAWTEGQLKLPVRVHNQEAVDAATLRKAKETAGRIFLEAGIRVEWRQAGDGVSQDVDNLHLAILPGFAGGGRSASREAGHAILVEEGFSTMARIFFGRVEQLSLDYRALSFGFLSTFPVSATQQAILGVVMAHEIAHLLLGRDSHRPDGVMAASIQAPAVYAAFGGQLAFAASQAAELRFEVMSRALHGGGFQSLPQQAPGVLECDLVTDMRPARGGGR